MSEKTHSIKNILRKIIYFILSPFLKETGANQSIYITFDDGPHPVHTLKILEILKIQEATATFFFNGELIEKYPDIVARTRDAGHQIGYHSYQHTSLKKLDFASTYRDLRAGKKLLNQLGISEYLYRPPYGDLTLKSILLLILGNWKIIMWSVEGRDSFDSEEQVIKNINVSKISNGSIILLHDVYDKTPRVLPVILKNLINADLKPNRLTFK